jgi:hypothetical protein
MTVCDLWRVLSPGVEIEIYSGGVEIANDLPFYFSNDLLERKIERIINIKKNKIVLEVY